MPLLILVAFMLISAAALASGNSEKNKGAAHIDLYGGKRGKVHFPHHIHQEKLVDCQVCHAVFGQKTGIIEELKAEGKLKKKYVMNKLCTKCHRQKKRAGEKSGPTTCSRCHIKK